MDASARIRRILWGTLRGSVPTPRALDMMVRWEANFAPSFERDPTDTVTDFLQQELGANLQREECSALADRILGIMDDFNGVLPQDPIVSIRRLSEARLSAQPASPVAAWVDVPPPASAEPPVAIDPAPADDSQNDRPQAAEQSGAEPGPVAPVESDEPLSETIVQPQAAEPAILLDADHTEPENIDFVGSEHRQDGATGMDDGLLDDAELAHLPGSIWPEDADAETIAPTAIITTPRVHALTLDDVLDVDYYDIAPKVPRGFESARTLEILPPADEPDLRDDHVHDRVTDIDAEPDPDVIEHSTNDTEIPTPPQRPSSSDPSAPYGIDRSVFSRIFLEHD